MAMVSFVHSNTNFGVEGSSDFIKHEADQQNLTWECLGLLSVLHGALHSPVIRPFPAEAAHLEMLETGRYVRLEWMSGTTVDVELLKR